MRLQEAVSRLWSVINSHSEWTEDQKETYFAAILSALRGPDAISLVDLSPDLIPERIKCLTTGRIRNFLGISYDNCLGWTVKGYYFFSKNDLKFVNESLSPVCGYHFSNHINRAVDAIKDIFGVDLMDPEEMAGVSNSKIIWYYNSDTD